MRKPKLIPNWKKTARYAWSLRLQAIGCVCSVGEFLVPLYADKFPRGVMAIAATVFIVGGMIARFFQQRNMKNGDE
jgi:hypothetical protein